MIHNCSGSSHDCYKCSLHHSILLWCPWGCIFKNNPQLILVSLSFQDLILSSIITPDNLHLDLVSFFRSLYPINNTFNLFILFSKRNSPYTLLLHQPTSPNVVFLPCLVFSLMRCPNISFLQDSYSYLHSSLGYSSVLFSPMSNSGNYSLCLSSLPCNTLLWHPSHDVQHVLSLCGSILFIVFHLQLLH